VFHGSLGKHNCNLLVKYFESRGGDPIEVGDNPANWMLRVLDSKSMGDLAEIYRQSEEYKALRQELQTLESARTADSKIEFETEFAAPAWKRRRCINSRMQTIYWISPSYNYARLLVSLLISFVLGSSFVTKRKPLYFTENDMRSRVSVIFLTFIITGARINGSDEEE